MTLKSFTVGWGHHGTSPDRVDRQRVDGGVSVRPGAEVAVDDVCARLRLGDPQRVPVTVARLVVPGMRPRSGSVEIDPKYTVSVMVSV